jgi:molybdate transport system substrate-binding protein
MHVMKKALGQVAAGFALLLAFQVSTPARTEISAFMTVGVQSAMDSLLPVFEKTSGYHIVPTWGTSAMMAKRVRDGEGTDVLISTRAEIDALIKEGKVLAGSDTVAVSSRVGVAVRRGAPKPDISTSEALKQTILAARAIAYSDPAAGGASGVHFASILKRFGIAEQMKTRTKFPPPGGLTATLLVSGEVDLAIQQMPELTAVEGSELVGPLPADLQLVTTFVAGVPTNARQVEAARTLLRFLLTPEAMIVMKAKGLEIGGPYVR